MYELDQLIIGRAKSTQSLKKLIRLIGKSESAVLITGPTGSGKELVAEALHHESRRKGKFVAINCAAIPQELMEAEILGFEKGAFTGAIKTTKGKFEQANNGTLFLDEIGDMPNLLQTKLLRVLENSHITRVGGDKDIKVSVRVVCATHKDLDSLVDKQLFREDLLFRLNVFQISVPPLRERLEDIPTLIDFLSNKRTVDGVKQRLEFTESGYNKLKQHHWPGNIRELRNVVERAQLFFPSKKIESEDVENFLLQQNSTIIDIIEEQDTIWDAFDDLSAPIKHDDSTLENKKPPKPIDFASVFTYQNSIDVRALLRDIEIVLIGAALDRNAGNTSEAAKDLKLLRTTLIEKIKKYGIISGEY
jgi:sigma-54 specific flagellar transcriptional regulator A